MTSLPVKFRESIMDNVDVIYSVLNDINSVYDCDKYGWTAIHVACKHGLTDLVERLLDKDANQLTIKTAIGDSPLSLAIEFSLECTVKSLLRKGANPNYISKFNSYPLCIAALGTNGKIVDILLKAGANARQRNFDESTALHAACLAGNIKAAKILIKSGDTSITDCDINGSTALHEALRSKNAKLLAYLLKKLKNKDLTLINTVTKDNKCPITLSIHEETTKCLQLLLKNKVDVNMEIPHYHSALNYAILRGNLQHVKLLFPLTLDNVKFKKCDAANKYSTCLFHTALKIKRNKSGILNYLLDNGIDVNLWKISQTNQCATNSPETNSTTSPNIIFQCFQMFHTE